jgi:hypothetical protein
MPCGTAPTSSLLSGLQLAFDTVQTEAPRLPFISEGQSEHLEGPPLPEEGKSSHHQAARREASTRV